MISQVLIDLNDIVVTIDLQCFVMIDFIL